MVGNRFRKQYWKIVFENCSLIFIEQKFIWKPKIFLTYFLNIFKNNFISSILFLIILHIYIIIFLNNT